MPTYGSSLLSLSLGLSVITIFLVGLFIRRGDDRFFYIAQRTSLSVCFLVALSTVTLLASLLNSNFDVDYFGFDYFLVDYFGFDYLYLLN